MTILAVDDKKEALKRIAGIVEELRPDAELYTFTSSLDALAKARETEVDTAFISVRMQELSGLDLGQYLKDLYPAVNLIFLSEKKEYAFDAIALRASGYLLKPAEKAAVQTEFAQLRYPEEVKNRKRVFAQTFGNFELFIDGVPVAFKYSKTKEIVALLINNKGVQTTNGEIIASLWEDDGDPKVKSSYLSNLRQDLQNTLTDLKQNDIIIKQRGSMAIVMDKIDCDLYEWLAKKKRSGYQYLGDYMNQYSWAEFVHAELDEISYMLDEEGA